MATLQNIRTKAGLLVSIVIFLSLAAFILGDMLSSGNKLFERNRLQIAEINGESIQYTEFQSEVDRLGEIYKSNSQNSQIDDNTWEQIRQETWNSMVEKNLMMKTYEKLGIDVSSDELFDMMQGNNIHPFIQQSFRNQTTGQFDKNMVIGFLKNLESPNMPAEQRNYWFYMEKQIAQDRLKSKYLNMLGKGMYATTEEAQNSVADKSKQVSFDFIALNNNSVADSQVVLTDKELRSYFEKHKESYKQETQRKIEYVTFPIVPSAADFKVSEKWINDIKPEFEVASDNVQFVNTSSDEIFDSNWYKKEILPANLAEWAFSESNTVNSILGPYFENNTYKLSKINAFEMLPDSVQARHILLEVKSQEQVASLMKLADSLKNVIDNGGNFATLALLYSTDQGSKMQGGDLGWFKRGMMVKPFEEAAFSNKKNEIKIATSQFGIHIVQTTNRGIETKHVQIATISRKVIASTKTSSDIYSNASRFISQNKTKAQFDAAVANDKLEKKVATVSENERTFGEFINARMLIRAANETDKGSVIMSQDQSPIFEIGDNFVVAVLADVTEKGISSFENSKTLVELKVLNDKKAEYLVRKLNNASEGKSDLASIAAVLGTSVETVNDVNFNSFQVPILGMEPAVVGAVTSLEANKISKPIIGNNGVYLVKVNYINQGTDQNVADEKLRLAQNTAYRATTIAFEAIKNVSKIVDKRSKFY